jgi:hypothetical protein
LEDQRQTVLLKQAWDDSGEVYGYRKLHDDLCDLGEDISHWNLSKGIFGLTTRLLISVQGLLASWTRCWSKGTVR